MTINIMKEYIEITKKQIEIYLRLVFDELNNQKYNDLYIEKYINVRYYNFFCESESTTIRKTLLKELKRTEEYAISNNLGEKEFIEQIYIFFNYVLYFDDVIYCKDLKNKISQISKLRKKILNKENEDFETNLYNEITEKENEKKELLKKFDTNEFFLKVSKYKNNIYRVNLKHNFKFPMEYSQIGIEKVFNMGITNEDKLVIEYYLIIVQIIKDIIRQNFQKQYVLEFAETLFSKPKKIKSILNCIDNVAIQDKTSLKIRYEYFIENKEIIYELMREGYRFSIILDNSFIANYKNMENLKMFKFVILDKESKQYEAITQLNDSVKNNIIEI